MHTLLADYLLQHLQETCGGTLPSRVFNCLRDAILEGVLVPNTRLPASRDLANELNVSRNTVLNAYEKLRAEGYIQAHTGRGTWVSETLPDHYIEVGSTPSSISTVKIEPNFTLSDRAVGLLEHAAASPYQWGAFVPGVPDVTEFPHVEFNRIKSRLSRQPEISNLIYSNAGGCIELRQALAEYLKIARSVNCETDQIIITEGIHQAVDLISRALCDLNDEVWIENPGYWGAKNILRINGLSITPIPVDAEGIIPKEQPQITPRLIFVTPSHQYPLGSHLSLSRRRKLLDIAKKYNSWIIEDDYDSEFRFSGQPYPSLQGLEENTPVIYIGTFSKTIYPALRIGYMVVPKQLVHPLRTISAELYRGGHLLTQQALAEFIVEGHYAAHIRRMRLLYAKRHKYLIELIHRYLGEEFLHEYNHDAGLHLVLKLPEHANDVEICRLALSRSINVRPLSQYYSGTHTPIQQGLLLGFACVQEQDMTFTFSILRQCLIENGVHSNVPKINV
ncbi:MocR-like pyridoxine biosynthesis transcription factor PdxR [Acinetobacter bereziniae]|uniref:MocR-like pyridoxine biosynthesis transcription factor PdxR n=1 Tax=Acinetobacter bereziniae TaxID=106648 RepID=UPI0019003A28|nr:PLP-dependent aminotransferase family protein [Acinetobacter bereziniae]MBJ8551960.1 PLP-dependent aminotransferase family protein [Acinetobacter bereziniae]